MIVREMVELICKKLSKPDTGTMELCKKFLNQKHKYIYDSMLWQEALIKMKLGIDGNTVVLPRLVELIQVVELNGRELKAIDLNSGEEEGSFSLLSPVGLADMPQNEPLMVMSTNEEDEGLEVCITGMGVSDTREFLTLNGTEPVQTSFSYNLVNSFSKGVSKGSVVVKGANTGKDLQVLSSTETMKQHVRIKLNATVKEGSELTIVAKKKCPEVENDLDVPALTGMENALIAYTEMAMYEYMRQLTKATVKGSEAKALLETMISQEMRQKQRNTTAVPYTSKYQVI